jgi:hypothetical protein
LLRKKPQKMAKLKSISSQCIFLSKALAGSKKSYSKIEICYAVIMSARKLRHYVEAHTIKVLTNQLLNDIFSNRESTGRISKWVKELTEYVVDFEKKCDKITNSS